MDGMQDPQRLSKILDKINARWSQLFDWLTCEDLGRDWDGAGDPYNTQKPEIAGRDADIRPLGLTGS